MSAYYESFFAEENIEQSIDSQEELMGQQNDFQHEDSSLALITDRERKSAPLKNFKGSFTDTIPAFLRLQNS